MIVEFARRRRQGQAPPALDGRAWWRRERSAHGEGLIGLIFFVPLFGMAVGAAAGAAGGAMQRSGRRRQLPEEPRRGAPAGGAALIVLVSKVTPDKILPEIKVPGTVIQTSLTDADEQALQEALDKVSPPPPPSP